MKKSSKVVLAVVVVVVVAAAVAGIVAWRYGYLQLNQGAEPTTEDKAPAQGVSVVLSPVREMVFEDRLHISGNVEAKNTALVSARIPGALDDVYVDEGDTVKAGTTKLFQTDKIKLSRARESAGQQVAVAAAAVRARQATVERINADLAKVQIDYDRYKRLYQQDHAVTKSAFETQESHLKQVRAGLTEAKAGLELARAQEDQAKSSLAIVQKDLSDSLVLAPISGKVSKRMLEPGEMAGAGTPVLRVDDLSVVELVAYLPEAYYARVQEGSTVIRARASGVDIGEMVVTTKIPTIHPRLRTFEIKMLLKDPPAGVVPGGRVELVVVLDKRKALGVPRQAVVRRGKGLAVFTAADGVAHMLAVQTGLEMDGLVEVSGDGLTAGMSIVRMGQDRLNDAMGIIEVKEDAE